MSVCETAGGGKPPVALWFGKHRGKLLPAVPTGYLLWVLENVKLSRGVLRAVRAELASRPDAPPMPAESEKPPPACHRCGRSEVTYSWHQIAGGRRQVRISCDWCGGMITFAPQTPENVARADASQPKAGLLDCLTLAESEGVRLVRQGGVVRPEPYRLASLELLNLIRQCQHQLLRHLPPGRAS